MRTMWRSATGCLAVAVVAAGCGDDKVPLADVGELMMGPTTNPEPDLRDSLVTTFHADEDDADCIAAEAFKEQRVPRIEGEEVYYTYTVDELAVYAARCGVDMDELWTTNWWH